MATKRPRFKVGDTVFYPSAGVGAILAVEDIYHSGQVESCFVIRIQDTQMTVKVPRSNLERSGIRPLLDGKVAQAGGVGLEQRIGATPGPANVVAADRGGHYPRPGARAVHGFGQHDRAVGPAGARPRQPDPQIVERAARQEIPVRRARCPQLEEVVRSGTA